MWPADIDAYCIVNTVDSPIIENEKKGVLMCIWQDKCRSQVSKKRASSLVNNLLEADKDWLVIMMLKLKIVHLYGYSSAFPHTRTRTAFPSAM